MESWRPGSAILAAINSAYSRGECVYSQWESEWESEWESASLRPGIPGLESGAQGGGSRIAHSGLTSSATSPTSVVIMGIAWAIASHILMGKPSERLIMMNQSGRSVA